MSIRKIAVLGAGNGGCAAAADLTLRGYEVRLFSRSESTLAPIDKRGGIELVENGQEKFAVPFFVSSHLPQGRVSARGNLSPHDKSSLRRLSRAIYREPRQGNSAGFSQRCSCRKRAGNRLVEYQCDHASRRYARKPGLDREDRRRFLLL